MGENEKNVFRVMKIRIGSWIWVRNPDIRKRDSIRRSVKYRVGER